MMKCPLLLKRWKREEEEAADEARRRRETLVVLKPVLKRFGIRQAIVFGSICQGRARQRSDIDLYVEPLTAESFWKLRHALEEAAGFPIDLHDPSDDPTFVRKVKERGEVFYES